jgi:serine/threonine protein kinase
MAPEQGMGREIDGRADVYALGVVLYELVTGRKPFTADIPMAVIFKHLTDPLPRPRDFVPGLPTAVEQIIFKAMAKKPEDRYPTMREFAAQLEKLVQSSPEKKDSIPWEPSSDHGKTAEETTDANSIVEQNQKRGFKEKSRLRHSWMAGGIAIIILLLISISGYLLRVGRLPGVEFT